MSPLLGNASDAAKTGGALINLTIENILSLRKTLGETYQKVKHRQQYLKCKRLQKLLIS